MADVTFPFLHRVPARGWINDPNGLSHIDGRYHVFFQYNPKAPVHDAITWGHVSSTDLLHWDEHPIALSPQPDGPDRDGCWSGCIVDDHGVPTAVYTAVRGGPRDGVVALATSDRSLLSWQQEPVAVADTPRSATIDEARDPFVFTRNGHRYAVQGCGVGKPGSIPSIMLWACDDLRNWIPLGPLLTGDDPIAADVARADIWECPALVQLKDAWVLVVSRWRSVAGTFDLNGTSYLIGDLAERDGGGLSFEPTAGGAIDHGPAFYAPQLLALPDRVLMWGWSWELGRSPEQVDAAGWAGTLTSPRELSIADGRLVNQPADEMASLRRSPLERTDMINTSAFELASDGPISLSLSSGDNRNAVIDAEFFGTGPSRILVDGSLVEAFSQSSSFTTRAYPTADSCWITAGEPDGYRLGQ
jgi:beta-fructofuranosidase